MKSCEDCKKKYFTTAMTSAECGHMTSRGGMKLCGICAKKQDACEACGKKLAAAPPADSGDDPPPNAA